MTGCRFGPAKRTVSALLTCYLQPEPQARSIVSIEPAASFRPGDGAELHLHLLRGLPTAVRSASGSAAAHHVFDFFPKRRSLTENRSTPDIDHDAWEAREGFFFFLMALLLRGLDDVIDMTVWVGRSWLVVTSNCFHVESGEKNKLCEYASAPPPRGRLSPGGAASTWQYPVPSRTTVQQKQLRLAKPWLSEDRGEA